MRPRCRALELLLAGPALRGRERFVRNAAAPVEGEFFGHLREELLARYLERTPSAARALEKLADLGARRLVNDHIALRSFVDSEGNSGLLFLKRCFTRFGFAERDSVVIPGLPVDALWLEPPEATDWPKVFISQLRVADLPSARAREIIYGHVDGYYGERGPAEAEAASATSPAALAHYLDTPPWNVSVAEEGAVREVSEYAAWTLTQGHRWNHATILANALALEGVTTLQDLNALFLSLGFRMNAGGQPDGLTQGSRAVNLEQSSTLADTVDHTFKDGQTKRVPCAFLELIMRHRDFTGFLGNNAKGIFDSTSLKNRQAAGN